MADEILETTETTEAPETPDYTELLSGIDMDAVKAAGGMLKYIQSQADARATKALNTARANWEKEQAEQKDEATRLAKMTEAEKAKYQFEKDREAFEQERAKFAHDQLVVETQKQMNAAGLPDLAEFITGKDAETTKANLTAVSGILSAWKQEQLNGMMRGTPPKDVTPGRVLTKDDIKGMSADEINAAWKAGLIDTKALGK